MMIKRILSRLAFSAGTAFTVAAVAGVTLPPLNVKGEQNLVQQDRSGEKHEHQGKAGEGRRQNDGHKHQDKGKNGADKDDTAHGHGEQDTHSQAAGGDKHGEDRHGENEPPAALKLTSEQIRLAGIESFEVARGSIDLAVDLAGEVHLNQDRVVQVVPRISGVVSSVESHLGDLVEKGMVMAVIASRELADAKSAYIAARKRASLARTKFEREERLWNRQISSEQEYLDAQFSLAEAEIAELAAAQKLIALGLSPAAVNDISSNADESLTRFEIAAPISGTVIEKKVSVGSSVEENDAIFRVANLGLLWVIASVYEKDIAKIGKGAPASIETRAYPGRVFSGKITWVSDTVDERTRTVKVRAEVENGEGLLKPGMFVRASVVTSAKENVLTIPLAAIRRQGGETVVFVDEGNGRYVRRDVVLGQQSGGKAEVLKGLKAGERVVSAGSFVLKSELEKEGFEAGHGH